jgi:hypothetical protein
MMSNKQLFRATRVGLCVLTASLVLLASSSVATAAPYYWVHSGSGEWSNNQYWNTSPDGTGTSGPPLGTSLDYVNNSGTAVISAGENINAATLRIGPGTVTQSNGTLSLSATIVPSLVVGYGAAGSYNLTGAATTVLTSAGAETIGQSGTGTFIQSGGTNYANGGLAFGGGGSSYSLSNGTLALGAGSSTTISASNFSFTGGTLLVNGTLNANAGLVVGSGSTLGGTGTIAGNVTVNGNLLTGNSLLSGQTTPTVGTLTFSNNLTLASGSVSHFTLGSPGLSVGSAGANSDLVKVMGTLALQSLTFDSFDFTSFDPLHPFGAGVYTLFDSVNAITGWVSDLTGAINGLVATLSLANNNHDLVLTVPSHSETTVPEPSTMLIWATGLALWGFARKRKLVY